MIRIRPSRVEDVPRQRELWQLAFGDSGPYVDNFYHNYYRPERVLVLEREGQVRAMTAWFDTTLCLPDGAQIKAGYLYAVATHPKDRGQGYAGALIRYAGEYLSREHGCKVLTTVPAQPSLHRFFAANGFRESFTHRQQQAVPSEEAVEGLPELIPVTPQEYGQLREQLLEGTPHIRFPLDALVYQQGCCAISGGGLYKVSGNIPSAVVCAEGMEDGSLLVKELLCGQNAEKMLTNAIYHRLPAFGGWYRTPGKGVEFGMIKRISDDLTGEKNWEQMAYMGFGFD